MTKLSAHFSTAEFQCKGRDGCKLILPPSRLLLVLEDIRYHTGETPLRIVSGYRCERHNDKVGGAFASRHLRGDAADLEPGRVTLEVARAAGATGIGIAGPWVTHVDVRPGKLTEWFY